MNRKDLEKKYDIIGENKDIMLFRKGEDKGSGIGYAGNISLVRGNAVFNGTAYTDIASLDNALREWENGLEFPVDTYCPMINEAYRLDQRLTWYLSEKMGFKHKESNWKWLYAKNIGPNAELAFDLETRIEEGAVVISCKLGGCYFTQKVTDAHEGFAVISSIVNVSVLSTATDIVELLAVCPKERTAEIDAYVESNENIFGLKKVSFKDLMIQRLEQQLKALKGE